MIQGYNKRIAVKPPETKGSTQKVVNGVAQTEHRSSLAALEVVYGNHDIPSGSTVYVNWQLMVNQPWSTAKHTVKGQEVVLCPEDQVLLVDRPEPVKSVATQAEFFDH